MNCFTSHHACCIIDLGGRLQKRRSSTCGRDVVAPQPSLIQDDLQTTDITHHELGHREDLRQLLPSILAEVENLTRVERELYLVALKNLTEIAWLESDAVLGRWMLCNDVIDKWELELAYLNLKQGNGNF